MNSIEEEFFRKALEAENAEKERIRNSKRSVPPIEQSNLTGNSKLRKRRTVPTFVGIITTVGLGAAAYLLSVKQKPAQQPISEHTSSPTQFTPDADVRAATDAIESKKYFDAAEQLKPIISAHGDRAVEAKRQYGKLADEFKLAFGIDLNYVLENKMRERDVYTYLDNFLDGLKIDTVYDEKIDENQSAEALYQAGRYAKQHMSIAIDENHFRKEEFETFEQFERRKRSKLDSVSGILEHTFVIETGAPDCKYNADAQAFEFDGMRLKEPTEYDLEYSNARPIEPVVLPMSIEQAKAYRAQHYKLVTVCNIVQLERIRGSYTKDFSPCQVHTVILNVHDVFLVNWEGLVAHWKCKGR